MPEETEHIKTQFEKFMDIMNLFMGSEQEYESLYIEMKKLFNGK